MALNLISSVFKPVRLAPTVLRISVLGTAQQERSTRKCPVPVLKYPHWYIKQFRTKYDEMLTPENQKFIQEIIEEQYGPMDPSRGPSYLNTPLKQKPLLRGEWFPRCRRSGLIGIKLGVLRHWYKDGTSCLCTLIQILDNHVIKYIPPEQLERPRKWARRYSTEGKMGGLVVGAVNCDPQMFTKDYNGLFSAAGVMPKKLLTKFIIHPCAAIQPGTQLYAAHFKVGDYLDITGKTIYRGFEGAVTRHKFKGGKASHGATKTHRRTGNIASGSGKARVWPGKKMPGHWGLQMRTMRGLQILRINHRYNVLYVKGTCIPGDVNSFVFLHDTLLPVWRLKESPRFPTYYPEDYPENPLPEEEYAEQAFNMSDPSIIFEEEKVQAKKK